MTLSKRIEKINNKKQIIDRKISIIENRFRTKAVKDINKLNNKKKKLAKIFLLSNYKLIAGRHIFSMYEIYTIGGLIILNELDSYKSTVLLASYNQVVKLCFDTMRKNIIYRQGKESYIEDRKINKDIQDKLCLINGILIRAKRLIEDSDLEQLHQAGNSEFIKKRKAKIEHKYKCIIDQLKTN